MKNENEAAPGTRIVAPADVKTEERRLLGLNKLGKDSGEFLKEDWNHHAEAEAVYPAVEDQEQQENYVTWAEQWKQFQDYFTEEKVQELNATCTQLMNAYHGADKRVAEELQQAIKHAQELQDGLKEKSGTGDLNPEKMAADNTLHKLLEDFGRDYEKLWSKESVRKGLIEAQYEKSGKTKLEGFEAFGSQREAYEGEIRSLLDGGVGESAKGGKGWYSEGIHTVRFEAVTEGDLSGPDAVERSRARTTDSGSELPDIVVRGDPSELTSATEVRELVSRAIARYKSWENITFLPVTDRAEFLKRVMEIKAEDTKTTINYRGRIDTLPNDAPDADTRYRDVMEYWATVNELYDRDQESLLKENEAVYHLVEKWRKRLILNDEEGHDGTRDADAPKPGQGATPQAA